MEINRRKFLQMIGLGAAGTVSSASLIEIFKGVAKGASINKDIPEELFTGEEVSFEGKFNPYNFKIKVKGKYIDIGSLVSISSRNTIDVTSLDSTDGYREFIGGFNINSSYVDINLDNVRPSKYKILENIFNKIEKIECLFLIPENTKFSFTSYIESISRDMDLNDTRVNMSLQITGEITIEC